MSYDLLVNTVGICVMILAILLLSALSAPSSL